MNSTAWPAWVCPVDEKHLSERGTQLVCPDGHEFAVLDAIPRLVSTSNYADHFGAQWNKYRLTQLDSYTGHSTTRDRIRRCVGEELWNTFAGKRVLECGCGAGRFTEILLDRGALVTSIDLSTAVDANVQNFPLSDTHRIAQADILHLPFPPQSFDVVFCLGVIQHTPHPEETIASLYSRVAPGGSLIIDHYTYTIGWYTKTAPLFRAYLKRLPTAKALVATEKLVDWFLPWHKRVRNFRPGRILVHHLSPVLSFYALYPELDDRLQREWALLDTHDSLTDWYKHFRTRKQIYRTLAGLGLQEIWCEYGGNGVEARGKRAR
jgi:2-polyprenyl-3-methyl-5-hydroxy-6-metoxy-1,4-benzoquinol methylase